MTQPAEPIVSVIIAAHNATGTLRDQLAALAGQLAPPLFEVIVVDNRSTDDPVTLVTNFPSLAAHLVRAYGRPGQSYARNVGAAEARGEHLLFCDADDVVSSTWVRSLSTALTDRRALVTGPIEVSRLNDDATWRAYVGPFHPPLVHPYAVESYLPFAYGCNMGIRRADFLALGGMDNSYRGGDEDTDFSWRAQEAGLEFVEVPDAVVHYRLRRTPLRVFQQRRGYARGRVLTWVRSTASGRPVGGMSLKWTAREVLRLPGEWLRTRSLAASRLGFASKAGALIGNLEGQLRYRFLRMAPAPEFTGLPPSQTPIQ